MNNHAKTALSLALAIVGGIAAGMCCNASEWVENSSQTNPRHAAYTVKAYTEGSDPFIPLWAFRRGETAGEAQLKKLAKVLKKKAFEVVVDLRLGKGESSVYTCDLSLDYVHINADYTT